MASREHWSNNGNIHVKVSTIHTNIVGSFIEWGVEAWRERKYNIPVVWWNPVTWGGYEWRREGSPPVFSIIRFIRGDGTDISTSLNPSVSTPQSGYHKFSVTYFFVNFGNGNEPIDLGNDARSVAKVEVMYEWQGNQIALSGN
jgi:hypothetical protein